MFDHLLTTLILWNFIICSNFAAWDLLIFSYSGKIFHFQLFKNTWNYVKNAGRNFFGIYSNTIENAWLTELEQKKHYEQKNYSDKRTIGQKNYSDKRINWTTGDGLYLFLKCIKLLKWIFRIQYSRRWILKLHRDTIKGVFTTKETEKSNTMSWQ